MRACRLAGNPGRATASSGAARRFVKEGLLDPSVLAPAPKRQGDDRLAAIVAALLSTDPKLTLREIAQRLEALYEPTPRGGRRWQVSSVKMVVDRATVLGLLADRDPA